MISYILYLQIILFIFNQITYSNSEYRSRRDIEEATKRKSEYISDCDICRNLGVSVMRGLEKTRKSNYGGGDAAWAKKKLGNYEDSELRLIEIQEQLCDDLQGLEKCKSMAEKYEEIIEEWYYNQKSDQPNIIRHLCIDHLKICCSRGFFGPNCSSVCPGGDQNPCNGNGECQGSGDTEGTGECKCKDGFNGTACDECSTGFYQDTTGYQMQCLACDRSCEGHCRGPGSKGCTVCKEGFNYDAEYGCTDVDECIENKPCNHSTFCVNSEGSYKCLPCDKACDGCNGDAPDMCTNCAEGYSLKEGFCIENDSWKKFFEEKFTRYATYFGLCLSTCIIFRRNPLVASVIGALVALYIGVAEYLFGTMENPNQPQIFQVA